MQLDSYFILTKELKGKTKKNKLNIYTLKGLVQPIRKDTYSKMEGTFAFKNGETAQMLWTMHRDK